MAVTQHDIMDKEASRYAKKAMQEKYPGLGKPSAMNLIVSRVLSEAVASGRADKKSLGKDWEPYLYYGDTFNRAAKNLREGKSASYTGPPPVESSIDNKAEDIERSRRRFRARGLGSTVLTDGQKLGEARTKNATVLGAS